MNLLKKEQIFNCLAIYCERYDSQNKAAKSLRDVSSGTISQMLSRKWELISDAMWRNVGVQIGYKENSWELVETQDHRIITKVLTDAKENALVMAITGNAGSGKSFALKHFQASNKNVFLLNCNEFWNKKNFMSEILISMGKEYKGILLGEMMLEAVRGLKVIENPILIFDEADKLSDATLLFFISLYNQLEDECAIILCATNHLEKSLKRGVSLNKKGYNEIWSRVGRRCVALKGVGASDIVAVCEANGVTDTRDIQDIIKDSDCDLRRVKRKVHAIKRSRMPANGDFLINND